MEGKLEFFMRDHSDEEEGEQEQMNQDAEAQIADSANQNDSGNPTAEPN